MWPLYRQRASKPNHEHHPQPFRLIAGQRTRPPIVVPYLFFGFGTLPATASRASHYFRMRPWLGRNDPALLCGGLQVRDRIARAISQGEKREIEGTLWRYFFSNPPTHVLRLGWKSLITGRCHDTLYLPVAFRYPGHSDRALAKAWGQYTHDYLLKTESRGLLCPASKSLLEAQIGWLTIAFVHHYWLLIEEPLHRHQER